MKTLAIKYLDKNHKHYKQENLFGRYITLKDIVPILQNLPSEFKLEELGKSFKEQSIYKVKLGNGKIKILLWSQMHGNESTGTKAMFDFFQFIINPLELVVLRDQLLKTCTFVFIPILNPDGAKQYTRLNAQKIDLNRDAIDLKAPESKLLHQTLHDFKPQFCFNLHDQRTIFSVGKDSKPATLSFLAPSVDIERTVTKSRMETMQVVSSMFKELSKLIPGQIGRYTDEFYPTATGDNFQKEGFNTILIEAGHFKDDYQREITRKYNFIALISGFYSIMKNTTIDYLDYFKIPNIEKNYLDIIYTNLVIDKKKVKYGVCFLEKLVESKVIFLPILKKLTHDVYYNANKLVTKKNIFESLEKFELYLKKMKN